LASAALTRAHDGGDVDDARRDEAAAAGTNDPGLVRPRAVVEMENRLRRATQTERSTRVRLERDAAVMTAELRAVRADLELLERRARDLEEAPQRAAEAKAENARLQEAVDAKTTEVEFLLAQLRTAERAVMAHAMPAPTEKKRRLEQALTAHRLHEQERALATLTSKEGAIQRDIEALERRLNTLQHGGATAIADALASQKGEDGGADGAAQQTPADVVRHYEALKRERLAALQADYAVASRRLAEDESRAAADTKQQLGDLNAKVAQAEGQGAAKRVEAQELAARLQAAQGALRDVAAAMESTRSQQQEAEMRLRDLDGNIVAAKADVARVERRADDELRLTVGRPRQGSRDVLGAAAAAMAAINPSASPEVEAAQRRLDGVRAELREGQAAVEQLRQRLAAAQKADKPVPPSFKAAAAAPPAVTQGGDGAAAAAREAAQIVAAAEKAEREAATIEERVAASQKEAVIAGLEAKLQEAERKRNEADRACADLRARVQAGEAKLKALSLSLD
jgi:chromosome segregation ATPase